MNFQEYNGTMMAMPDWLFHENFLDEAIITITADFSPNALEEILAQMGMVLP